MDELSLQMESKDTKPGLHLKEVSLVNTSTSANGLAIHSNHTYQKDEESATVSQENKSDGDIVNSTNYRQTVESDEDSSDSDESSDENDYFRKMRENVPPDERYGKKTIKVVQEELPPIENLDLNENVDNLRKIGCIKHSIIDSDANQFLVVVIADEGSDPLDEESVLFFSSGESLGKIHETFSNVCRPMYSIRFNNAEEISDKGVTNETPVYYSPNNKEFTRFVLVNQLSKQRGSDASWQDNAEPPDDQIDYSDDEQEKAANQKRRAKNRHREPDPEVEDVTPHKVERSHAVYNGSRGFPRCIQSPTPGPRLSPGSLPSPSFSPNIVPPAPRTASPFQGFTSPNSSLPSTNWTVSPQFYGSFPSIGTPPQTSMLPPQMLAPRTASQLQGFTGPNSSLPLTNWTVSPQLYGSFPGVSTPPSLAQRTVTPLQGFTQSNSSLPSQNYSVPQFSGSFSCGSTFPQTPPPAQQTMLPFAGNQICVPVTTHNVSMPPPQVYHSFLRPQSPLNVPPPLPPQTMPPFQHLPGPRLPYATSQNPALPPFNSPVRNSAPPTQSFGVPYQNFVIHHQI